MPQYRFPDSTGPGPTRSSWPGIAPGPLDELNEVELQNQLRGCRAALAGIACSFLTAHESGEAIADANWENLSTEVERYRSLETEFVRRWGA